MENKEMKGIEYTKRNWIKKLERSSGTRTLWLPIPNRWR